MADEPCRFIAFEDSGTTGLTGDTDQYHEIAGVRNPFYYFFRAEGQSNKLETGRGRWGLGKFVFPRSSRIRSFFGLTVRFDDKRRLLVGQSFCGPTKSKAKAILLTAGTAENLMAKKPGRRSKIGMSSPSSNRISASNENGNQGFHGRSVLRCKLDCGSRHRRGGSRLLLSDPE